MKIINTVEFRKELRKYLELAETTEVIIHNNKSRKSYRIVLVED